MSSIFRDILKGRKESACANSENCINRVDIFPLGDEDDPETDRLLFKKKPIPIANN